MLEVRGLKKNYGDFCLDVSLEVKKGYITGLIGRNGAGKSTLFKGIMGLIRPDSGDIEIFADGPLYSEVQKKQRIGAIFADSGFSQYFNIKEIASLMESMYPTFDKKSFFERCKAWELPLNKSIKKFSSGMLAKLKIIAATSYDARLLILDEPTVGLDVVARNDMADMIREYMMDSERSVLISSHISGDIESLCDDVYLIEDGQILLHEETNVIRDGYGILKMTYNQFENIDKEYLLRIKKEKIGIMALTDRRSYYEENYSGIVIERGNIDDIISLMSRGDER